MSAPTIDPPHASAGATDTEDFGPDTITLTAEPARAYVAPQLSPVERMWRSVVTLIPRTRAGIKAASPRDRRRILIAIGSAFSVALLILGLTIAGAVLQIRSQAALGNQLSATLATAAGAAGSADLSPLPVDPPTYGSAVGIVTIPALGLQQVIAEGQDSATSQAGPGHAPGTSMPGQPGNAVVIGRRTSFGAPFRDLDQLKAGDEIKVTTLEGSALYKVTETPAPEDPFAATSDARLTLITSNPPVIASSDLVVVAALQGRPLPPTPQNPRDYSSARAGMTSGWSQLLVATMAFGLLAGAVWVGARKLHIDRVVIWILAVPITAALAVIILRLASTFLPATL